MNPILCSRCRTANPPGARFCQSCGAMLGVTSLGGATKVHNPIPQPPVTSPMAVPVHGSTVIQPGAGLADLVTSRFAPFSPHQETDLLAVLDVSSSMNAEFDNGRTKIDAAKGGTINMFVNMHQIDPNQSAGLVSFTTHAQLVHPLASLASSRHSLMAAIKSLAADGGTDINAGLKVARDSFGWGRTAKRKILLLTDGQGGHPLDTAADLKNRGVVIEVLGVGSSPDNVDEELLRRVASVEGGETLYRFIKDHRTLVNRMTQVGTRVA